MQKSEGYLFRQIDVQSENKRMWQETRQATTDFYDLLGCDRLNKDINVLNQLAGKNNIFRVFIDFISPNRSSMTEIQMNKVFRG